MCHTESALKTVKKKLNRNRMQIMIVSEPKMTWNSESMIFFFNAHMDDDDGHRLKIEINTKKLKKWNQEEEGEEIKKNWFDIDKNCKKSFEHTYTIHRMYAHAK